MSQIPLPALDRPTMLFVGVTTGGSFINTLFPAWAEIMGLGDAQLLGIDLPPDAPPAAIRQAVAAIAENDLARGALVTTHKIAVHEHARDLFARFDLYAGLLGEVGVITKSGAGLVGHAKDPITVGLALDRIIARDHWRAHPEAAALLLGCGGASVALAAHLLERPAPERPRAIIMTDVSAARLDGARHHLRSFGADGYLHLEEIEGIGDQGRLVSTLPPRSLVVNGTGLGKDRPGSPLPPDALFPHDGIAWEFNYRGALDFLHQARAQAASRRLAIADGWPYFLYGWAHAIAAVFGTSLDEGLFAALEHAADRLR